MTNYFLDTEFIEDGSTIDLISIAIVCEDGRELYACSTDARLHRASRWVRENVLPHLPRYGAPEWRNRLEIANLVRDFTDPIHGYGVTNPRFWAYYADYDWVALCQLYGTMMDLPPHYPKLCLDLKQLSIHKGSPQHPQDPEDEHNALADARWNLELYNMLDKMPWVSP